MILVQKRNRILLCGMAVFNKSTVRSTVKKKSVSLVAHLKHVSAGTGGRSAKRGAWALTIGSSNQIRGNLAIGGGAWARATGNERGVAKQHPLATGGFNPARPSPTLRVLARCPHGICTLQPTSSECGVSGVTGGTRPIHAGFGCNPVEFAGVTGVTPVPADCCILCACPQKGAGTGWLKFDSSNRGNQVSRSPIRARGTGCRSCTSSAGLRHRQLSRSIV